MRDYERLSFVVPMPLVIQSSLIYMNQVGILYLPNEYFIGYIAKPPIDLGLLLYHFELFVRGCDLGQVGRICISGQHLGTCDIAQKFGHQAGHLHPVEHSEGTKLNFPVGQPPCDTGQVSDFIHIHWSCDP